MRWGYVIYTVTLNPSIDRSLTVSRFQVGGTFKASAVDLLPAGKGINVARVVATLGAGVTAIGLVGQHEMPGFAKTLSELGIGNGLVSVPGATRNCVTILDSALGTETHVREDGTRPPASALSRIQNGLGGVVDGDWVVLSGSLPPGVRVDTYRTLCQSCIDRGAAVLLDANGPPLLAGIEGLPTLFKPNLFELWQVDRDRATGTAEPDLARLSEAVVLDAARRVQARGVRYLVVSMGERGVLGLDTEGRAWRAQTRLDRPVVSAVGSGDALAAGLVVALSRGESFQKALRQGVACGAANTLVAGAGRCRLQDVERLAGKAVVRQIR
jgi:tagatose 6-phosphate kinase